MACPLSKHLEAMRPARTQSGNPNTPIRSQRPFWAGGQGPTAHRDNELRGRASFASSRRKQLLNSHMRLSILLKASLGPWRSHPAVVVWKRELCVFVPTGKDVQNYMFVENEYDPYPDNQKCSLCRASKRIDKPTTNIKKPSTPSNLALGWAYMKSVIAFELRSHDAIRVHI